MTADACIISLGISGPEYAGEPVSLWKRFDRGIKRIDLRLQETDFKGRFLYWDKTYPPGSPCHCTIPFAFKPLCFRAAANEGHQVVLWVDSSLIINYSLAPLFDIIANRGYLLFDGSHSVGEYCKDDALIPLGLSRSESFELWSCNASALGLNLMDHRASRFLELWTSVALDGVTFPGPKWSGVRGWPRTASCDPRVKGHRHDQTAASVLAHRLGMTAWESSDVFRTFFENDRRFVRELLEFKPA